MTVPGGAVLNSIWMCSTRQYLEVQYSPVPEGAVHNNTWRYSTQQYLEVQYSTIPVATVIVPGGAVLDNTSAAVLVPGGAVLDRAQQHPGPPQSLVYRVGDGAVCGREGREVGRVFSAQLWLDVVPEHGKTCTAHCALQAPAHCTLQTTTHAPTFSASGPLQPSCCSCLVFSMSSWSSPAWLIVL